MGITNDVQKLEPGNRIRLIEVDGDDFGAGILRFHNCTLLHSPAEIEAAGGNEGKLKAKSIWWQGNEYGAWPFEITGVSASTDGSAAQPKLSVANLDGMIGAICREYQDMVKAKVSIHDTFSHYLDATNFPEGNPEADPLQEFLQVFYIDSRSGETSESIEFTLSSPLDLQGLLIPTRQITSVCEWARRGQYRTGDGCAYAGQNGMFTREDVQTDDPSKDACSGWLSSCKMRFGETEQLDFGGFPGSALIRR